MPLSNSIDITAISLELAHRSYLYPDLTSDMDLTCTLTAGTSKAFGSWVELTDSSSNELSTIVASNDLHISAVRIRETSVSDKLYVIEIGYGLTAESVTTISPHDFGSGTKKIDSDEQVRVRADVIPAGQKIYGRLKCETNGAIATIVIRYHFD